MKQIMFKKMAVFIVAFMTWGGTTAYAQNVWQTISNTTRQVNQMMMQQMLEQQQQQNQQQQQSQQQNQQQSNGFTLSNSYVKTPTDLGNGATVNGGYDNSNTSSSNNYSNSSTSERRCDHCHGSGRCSTCNGNYTHWVGYVGATPKHCPNCSNGACRWCNGTGKR